MAMIEQRDDEAVQAVLRAADGLQDDTVALLQRLIRFRTENPKLLATAEPAEAPCQDFIRQTWADLGCQTDTWEVFPGRPDVVGVVKGSGGGRSLILNGHVDVVPAGDAHDWPVDPWAAELRDGAVWGRGACDMKGGLAAMTMAVRAVQTAGYRLRGDVILESAVDEETGGPGTQQCIDRGYRADAAIVTEPTELRIEPVEGGLEWLRVVVRGRSGHSALRYRSVHAGGHGTAVNAIEKTAKILAAVLELERYWAIHKEHPLLPRGITTINPGVIMGGTGGGKDGQPAVVTSVSTFPDYCSLELSLKYLPTETRQDVVAEFEDYIARVANADPWLREHPPEIEWGIRGVSFPPASTEQDHPFIQSLATSLEGAGEPVRQAGFVAVSDLAWIAAAGMPCALLGPGDAQYAHSANEHIAVRDLVRGTKVLALALLNWCGYEC
jgi:acetylornithine deacetylase